ncbi:MAG: methyltransferase domain-containing protein [Bacteroidota bacterium]
MSMYTSIEIPNLSQQLRCPKGSQGRELGRTMYDSNRNMIWTTISALRMGKKNRVLEIGPGSGQHISGILSTGPLVRYFGLDISETMVGEAQNINKEFIDARRAIFERYDGVNVPFVNSFFDRILSVNTIYFWESPERFLGELYRVLKPGGVLAITFVDASTMRDLPFVDGSFELFDIPRMTKLISSSQFMDFDIQTKTDQVKGKDDRTVDREYLVVSLKKKKRVLMENRDHIKKGRLKKMGCHGG